MGTSTTTQAGNSAESASVTGTGGHAGGRLSLSSSNPSYQPNNTVAVSGQDTTADTITVTAHGWIAGTMVKSDATSGGLTAATQYYVGNPAANSISLHTTVAAALAGTSKLDITGAVTANITANGIAATSTHYVPYVSDVIELWDGSEWQNITFTTNELALGTLTADLPYDEYAYSNNGVFTRERLAWSSATARATEVSLQDGRWCKTGDKTRRLLGTILPDSTTTTRNSNNYLGVANVHNKTKFTMRVLEPAVTWTYSTTTVRQVNANTANQVDFILPLPLEPVNAVLQAYALNSTTSERQVIILIGLDGTTVSERIEQVYLTCTNLICPNPHAELVDYNKIPIGKHYLAALEYGAGSDAQTWNGNTSFYQYFQVSINA